MKVRTVQDELEESLRNMVPYVEEYSNQVRSLAYTQRLLRELERARGVLRRCCGEEPYKSSPLPPEKKTEWGRLLDVDVIEAGPPTED